MSLDLKKLENVEQRRGKIVARCPACAALGRDRKSVHLVIFPDGKFNCVGPLGGPEHRRQIYALAGVPDTVAKPVTVRPVSFPGHGESTGRIAVLENGKLVWKQITN